MLRFKAFGPPVVEGPDGRPVEGAARQRRVLGLLAVVAAGRTRGVSRDRVLALLWPESDPERARQTLTQSLYHTRKALGADDVFLAAADLRLNPNVLSTDVNEFEEALDAGQLQRAVELYQGPFLDGFYVNGAPEFERWASEQRARLRGRYTQALEELAVRAAAAADHGAAVQWRQRLAALDPLNSRVALELMRSLATAGDRAGAIKHAQIHETMLREELNAAPNPAIVELADELRRTVLWHPRRVASHESDSGNVARSPTPESAASATPNVKLKGTLTRRRSWMAALSVATIAVASIVVATQWPTSRRTTLPADLTVVVPFRVAGADPALEYLREGIVDLLVAKLIDDIDAPAVDVGAVMAAWRQAGLAERADVPQAEALKIARQLRGTRVLLGSVVGTPSSLVVNATLLAVPDGSLRAQASAGGAADSLTAILDRLVARLVAKEAGEWERLANRTSTSVLALRAYLDGQAAYRRGAYRDAVRHFRTALERDGSFAMAGLALSNAAERLGSNDDRARGLAAAWTARGELTMRDSVYLAALAGPNYPAPSSPRESLAAWERAAAVTPDRADVWHELGERLFFDGRLLGVGDWTGRATAAFRRSAELDPGFASPLQYLVQLSAAMGDTVGVRQAATSYLRVDSIGDLAPFVRWRAAIARGDSAALRSLRARLTGWPAASLRSVVLSSQFNGIAIGDAERALSALMMRAARGPDRTDALLARHALALNVGDLDAALDATEVLEQDHARASLAQRLRILDALYGGADTSLAKAAAARLIAVRTAPETVPPAVYSPNEAENECVLAQWRAWTDHLDGSVPLPLAAATTDGRGSPACVALVDAIVAVRTRSPSSDHNMARLDSLVLAAEGTAPLHEYAPLVVARLHLARNDVRRALTAVRRRPHMRPWPHYLTAHLLTEARLSVVAGDTANAVVAFRHYLALRRSAHGHLADEVRSVRAELTALTRQTSN